MKKSKNRFQMINGVIILIISILCGILLISYSSKQMKRIHKRLNESAYTTVENTLTNLANVISNEFLEDHKQLETLASSCSNIDDISSFINNLEYTSDINGIYFASENEKEAIGKDDKKLDLSQLTFKEHANGITRSAAFMNEIGDYSYVVKEPVIRDGNTIGYLYCEYSMQRFSKFMPRDENIEGNNYSIMLADTMRYVYTPSGTVAGSHINFKRLQDYMQNKNEVEPTMKGIKKALQNNEYYMKISTLKNIYDTSNATDYVMFLWPIDDGEYYISGFSSVNVLQAERIDVESTIQTLLFMVSGFCIIIIVLIAIFFRASYQRVQQKSIEQVKHNSELSEALQIAKIANESKSNFLSNMSHDIRTPMNAIIGYTDILLKESDDPKIHMHAQKIMNSGTYLLNLINDILDMSKIESGKTTLSINEFQIKEMCASLTSMFKPQAANKGLTFTTRIEGIQYDKVLGDEVRVRQILTNILSNAIKYTPDGGDIEFNVHGIYNSDKGNYQKVIFQVSDNGCGISEENLNSIFEPFKRVDNTSTNKIQGTGLGLAIVKNLVNLIGGNIHVDSSLGKGSTFTVELTFPIVKDLEGAITIKAKPEIDDVSLQGMHILAAEDNELNAELLTEVLQMEGAKCTICENGKEVLSTFEQSKDEEYDVILMDVQMPVMNGYEATKAIRHSANPQAKTIPIIAMTANAFTEDVRNALDSGMNAHIAKPLDISKLKQIIYNLTRKEG